MNRGSVRSGRAAATAGLNRSVWPTASVAPVFAAASIMASASARLRAIGFSTSTGTPAVRNGSATSRCSSVGTAIVTASTWPRSVAIVDERTRAGRGRDLLRARTILVDDADEVDARQRRQDPRVMPAEMADADDGDSQRHRAIEATTRGLSWQEAIWHGAILTCVPRPS